MNYALAEQLKDAGFPQSGGGVRLGPPSALVWRTGDLAYAPTLEELLAACGEEFGQLSRLSDGRFQAIARGDGPRVSGKSPAEALARLWLAVNRLR